MTGRRCVRHTTPSAVGSLRSRVEPGCAAHSKLPVVLPEPLFQAPSCVARVRRRFTSVATLARGPLQHPEGTKEDTQAGTEVVDCGWSSQGTRSQNDEVSRKGAEPPSGRKRWRGASLLP